jgi:hypothetical protein
MSLTPAILFGSNKTSPAVTQVYGISGTGKTYFLAEMLKQTRVKDFGPLHRFVVFDVKHEGYSELVTGKKKPGVCVTFDGFLRSIRDNKITVVHPEMEDAYDFLDDVIAHLFKTSQTVKDFSATLVLEECSTFIGSHAASIPLSIKRFATQGRSLGLSIILANQRSLTNKWTDTQSQRIIYFRSAIPDFEMCKKKWGIDGESMDRKLSELKFSFAEFDLESLELRFYAPLPGPKEKAVKAPQRLANSSVVDTDASA